MPSLGASIMIHGAGGTDDDVINKDADLVRSPARCGMVARKAAAATRGGVEPLPASLENIRAERKAAGGLHG